MQEVAIDVHDVVPEGSRPPEPPLLEQREPRRGHLGGDDEVGVTDLHPQRMRGPAGLDVLAGRPQRMVREDELQRRGLADEACAGGHPRPVVPREHRHPVLERLQLRCRRQRLVGLHLDRADVGTGGGDTRNHPVEPAVEVRIGIEPERVGGRDRGQGLTHEACRIRTCKRIRHTRHPSVSSSSAKVSM